MQKPKYVSGKRWLPGKQIEIKSAGQVKCNPNSFQAPSSLHHLHILHLISHLSHLFRSNILLPCASMERYISFGISARSNLHRFSFSWSSPALDEQHEWTFCFMKTANVCLWVLWMFSPPAFCAFKLHRPRALIGRKDAHWRVVKSFGNHLAFKMMWVVNAVQLLC